MQLTMEVGFRGALDPNGMQVGIKHRKAGVRCSNEELTFWQRHKARDSIGITPAGWLGEPPAMTPLLPGKHQSGLTGGISAARIKRLPVERPRYLLQTSRCQAAEIWPWQP